MNPPPPSDRDQTAPTEGTNRSGSSSVWLFVMPWELHFPGGVNQVVLNLAREMQALGSMRPVFAINRWGQRKVVVADFAGLPLLRLWSPTPWTDRRPVFGALCYLLTLPLTLLRLARVLRQYDVAVVNVHYPNLSALNWMLLRRLGLFRGQLLISVHGLDVRNIVNESRMARFLWQLLSRGADAVVACSDGLRDETVAALTLAPGQVVTIHNGVSAQDIDAECVDVPLPAAMHGVSHRYIANIATFEYKKGQDLLIEAFRSIADAHPEVDLVIVGRTGEALAAVQDQIAAFDLADRVHLLQDLTHGEALSVLAGAEFFVLPSRNEGFALVLLEASALGRPIIATDVCGVPELIEDGRTGRIVQPEDVYGLARAMQEFILDPAAAATMGIRAQQRVRERFSWREKCAEYLRLGRSH